MTHLGWRRVAAAVIVAALGAGVAWGWPRPVSASVPPADRRPGTFGWLSLSHGRIVDGQGRTVLLRGMNVDNLTDPRNDELGPPTPLDARDAQLMQQAGFDVVRVPIAWSLLEPLRHRYDLSYLARVVRTVRLLERYRLRVILDMHFGQAWGPSADVPAWASVGWVPDIRPVPGRRWNSTISSRNEASYTYFWVADDWREDLLHAWQLVAGRFREDPGVVGYDIYNEPHPMPIPPGLFGARFLFPFYAQAISAIAAVDPNHLFFVESTLFVGLPTTVDRIRGAEVVYSPHLYAGAINNLPFQKATPALIRSRVRMRVAEGRAVGGAIWFGELGVDRGTAGAARLENSYLSAVDSEDLGWCWWEWRTGGGWGIRNIAGTHVDMPALRALAQPYLAAAPEGVVQGRSSGGALRIRVSDDHADQTAVVAWPGALDGAPGVSGSCLVGTAWHPQVERLDLLLAPGQGCSLRLS